MRKRIKLTLLSWLHYTVLIQHHHQRLSENLVSCSVDEWVYTEVNEPQRSEYVKPFIRQQSALLFTNERIANCYLRLLPIKLRMSTVAEKLRDALF